MGTVTLGNIKFNWKAAYNASTSYVIDDVVSYQGSTYVCILASTGNVPTNTTYWNLFAEGGDVATTLTTQGDILYRDGSGLARLGAGTAGEALITNGTGANPSWGSAGGIKQVIQGTSSTEFVQNSPTDGVKYYPSSNKITATITPSSTSSKILVLFSATFKGDSSSGDMGVAGSLKESISGGSTTEHNPAPEAYASGHYNSSFSGNMRVRLNYSVLLSPNTTSAITYEVGVYGYSINGDIKINDTSSQGRIILMEVTV